MRDHWTIGELAKESGLTVRALRHFDQIGLLSPAERSVGGHRMYRAGDIRRLFVILALRQLQLPLAEIAGCLDGELDLRDAISRRLGRLDRQMAMDHAVHHKLAALMEMLGEGQPVSPENLLDAMEAMTMREALRDTQAPDLYLLQLAQEATVVDDRRAAAAVLRTFRALGLINEELGLAISRIIHARSLGSDEVTFGPPMEATAPRLVAVLAIDRELPLGASATVWLVDLEVWDGQARVELRLPDARDANSLLPPLSGFERASLLPGRFGDLQFVDDAGLTYELAYTPGRGLSLIPPLGRGVRSLHVGSRSGAFAPLDLELGAATPLSFRPATPVTAVERSARAHLVAVAEEALYTVALIAGNDEAGKGVQAALSKVRAVGKALCAVGAIEDDEWCADQVENALRGIEPSSQQWRSFLNDCRHGRSCGRRIVPVATDVGQLDGVHVVLRSVEVSDNATRLNAALTRSDHAPEGGADPADHSWFLSWAQTIWRAEDDLGNLYLGAWGRSWRTGEFSVSLRPGLADDATRLTVLRRGNDWMQTVLDLRRPA